MTKKKILRAARQKKINNKGTPIRLSTCFSAEIRQARREWDNIFKILKDKIFQPRILYPAKISFRYDGEIKTFPNPNPKLREFISARHPQKEMLKKAVIHEKEKKKVFKKP
uniref:L1 transposable element dsRBD-like domain-containing protein n=1 Tax=Equus caballus TaxID=9796 RepID=A0A9L0S0C1_HORSE